jgi:putative ABC transport system permease protein
VTSASGRTPLAPASRNRTAVTVIVHPVSTTSANWHCCAPWTPSAAKCSPVCSPESALLGAVAAAARVIAGIGLARGLAALLAGFGLALPITGLSLPANWLTASFATGVVITVAAAVPPAWRATRVAPVQALRDADPAPGGFSARRLESGLAVTVIGIALLAAGLFAGAPIAGTSAGTLACFLGLAVLGPLFARPLAFLSGLPLTVLPGRASTLARRNAMRDRSGPAQPRPR